jgi:hypothetical protein
MTDSVALYDAAGLWYLDRGVPAGVLHGKDWSDEYMPLGVYNGAAEIKATAAVFRDHPEFHHVDYICSPGQVSRARLYALAYGAPVDVIVPESLSGGSVETFHDSHMQTLALGAITRTLDPYGKVVDRLTRDRIPHDGITGTLPDPELMAQLAALPWNSLPD